MAIVEKSFPRGGVELKLGEPGKPKENIIFGALQKKFLKPKKSKDDFTNLLKDSNKEDTIETFSAELLNYDTIQDGMNIMGVVSSIDPLFLTISLPGRMVARVSALNISEAYSKATKDFVQNMKHIENYKPLVQLYSKGQLVYGRVQDVNRHERGHTEVSLTLKPAEVHGELSHLNVKKAFIFNGAIEEVHEHGYIIEAGIMGMRTFLPLEKSQVGHAVGQLVFLKVEKITHSAVVSTCICKEIKAENMKIKNQPEPNLDYILPSSIVPFNVTKRLKDGLQGTVMNEAFTGYINEHQLADPLALPEDYEVNAMLNARVLYVMPLTKLVYLTLNLRNVVPEMAATDATVENYKRGDVIENAKVHHLGTGGVILVLDNKFKGIISFKTIKSNYKGNYDQDELLTKYAKKTQHKVRVLGYDLMDSMYICTDDVSVVNEKVFTLEDLRPGEFITGVVRRKCDEVGGYLVQVGKVKGVIEKLFLSPRTKQLEENAKIRCRVVAVNLERRIVYLTNRVEYMSKSCKVLTSLTDAKENAIYTGTVVKCYENYLLIKFFNHLKGVLHKHSLEGYQSTDIETFYEGQTMTFRIVGRNDEQITLCLAHETFQLGEICPIKVQHVLESGLEIKVIHGLERAGEEYETDIKGLIPVRMCSDFVDLLYAKMRMYPEDSTTRAVCIVKNIFSLRDLEYFESNQTKDFGSVSKGDILKAYVKNVADDIVELLLPVRNYKKLVRVHIKMLLLNLFNTPNILLAPEQVVYVKVLSKEDITKTITVSAKMTDVWDGELSGTAKYVESYLIEVAEIRKAFKKQHRPIAKYSIGDNVTAHFKGVHAETNDWQYELEQTKVKAAIKASTIGKAKPPQPGTAQKCVILWIDYSSELIYVSNRPGDIAHIGKSTGLPKNLVGKAGINAKIVHKDENVFICSLKNDKNPLVICPIRLHFNDFENSSSNAVKEGDFCRLAFIHETRPIAVLESTWKLWHKVNIKRKAEEEALECRRKRAKVKIEQKEQIKEKEKQFKMAVFQLNRKLKGSASVENGEVTMKEKEVKQKAKQQEKAEQLEMDVDYDDELPLFYEDKTPSNIKVSEFRSVNIEKPPTTTKPQKAEVKQLPGISDFWTTDLSQLNQNEKDDSSSEEEEDDDVSGDPTRKKRKPNAVEKFKQERDEEARLREIEERNADPNLIPDSVDLFDRQILSDPNNSKNWVNYMVFHLQSAEIDKARAVARRALKTISFRNDEDLLNIWIALLNLELRYGSKESFDETLKEALTYNDPLKTYLRTVEILSDTKRTQELMDMIGIITKKFRQQQEVWKVAANAYFSMGMNERAQQLMHKALASLPEREHVNTIVAFANLNHKHGCNEMAQTLLDQVVTSYPKRVDVWTQYVDLLIKEELTDSARSVLERAVIQKIPLKKMRTIFKKYLDFEERFGTEAEVQKVKNLATEYVKNNANL